MLKMTEKMLNKVKEEFNIQAKSTDLQVTMIGQNIYAYGTELEVLRLFAKFLANGDTATNKYRVGYSENMGTYYFTYEFPGFYN